MTTTRLVTVIMVLLVAAPGWPCGNTSGPCTCGGTLTENWTMDRDITCTAGQGAGDLDVGLYVNGGVTLTGNGHKIQLSGAATGGADDRDKGIVFLGTGSTVRQVKVSGFHWGIDFQSGAINNHVFDVNIYASGAGGSSDNEGIHFGLGSHDNTVECTGTLPAPYCELTGHLDAELYILSDGNTVKGMTAKPASGANSLYVKGSNNTFTGNTLQGQAFLTRENTTNLVTGNCFGGRGANMSCIGLGTNVITQGRLKFAKGVSSNTAIRVKVKPQPGSAYCVEFLNDSQGNLVRTAASDLEVCTTQLHAQGDGIAPTDVNTFNKGCCSSGPPSTMVESGGAITIACNSVSTCQLDVDKNCRLEVATDITYIARHLLGLVPVPPSFRTQDPGIPTDAAIAANIDALGTALDVDGNGTVQVATDIVYIARRLLNGLVPVPPSFRVVDPGIPSDLDEAIRIDGLCY